MTTTEHGYCPKCDERVELVPYTGITQTVLGCHKCGNLDIKDEVPEK